MLKSRSVPSHTLPENILTCNLKFDIPLLESFRSFFRTILVGLSSHSGHQKSALCLGRSMEVFYQIFSANYVDL